MKVTGMSLNQVIRCVERVSRASYAKNLVVGKHSRDRSKGVIEVKRCTFQLRAVDEYKPGWRMDSVYRNACWHAHFDVFDEMFAFEPNCVIETAQAVYKDSTLVDVAEIVRDDNHCMCVQEGWGL